MKLRPDYRDATAVISPCGRYRYHLGRTWNPALPRVTFLMLNPSTASDGVDDPTIRKCVGFATRWGCGGIDVVNLAAYRATDPIALYTARQSKIDVVGPENATYVQTFLAANTVRVAAWGAQHVAMFPASGSDYLGPFAPVQCLGRTRDGHPRHPLVLPYLTPLEKFA